MRAGSTRSSMVPMERSDVQERPADRCGRISVRCAPSPRREIHHGRTGLAKVAVAGAPVWRGEGAAREGALARYEPLPLPLPGVIQEGIVGVAAGAAAGAAAAFGFALRAFFFGAAAFFFLAATTFLTFFAFLAFAFDFFAFFAMFDLPIALANGPNLMPALQLASPAMPAALGPPSPNRSTRSYEQSGSPSLSRSA
jgi:hypothetical protein